MSEFIDWLTTLPTNDPDVLKVQQTFAANRAAWSGPPDRAALSAFLVQHITDDADRIPAMVAAGEVLEMWTKRAQPETQSWLGWLKARFGQVAIILFGTAVFASIAIGLSQSHFLELIANETTTRALITFIVVVATMSIALLSAAAAFWVPVAEIDARMSKAKDFLTILVGILGTILGFYFGSAG